MDQGEVHSFLVSPIIGETGELSRLYWEVGSQSRLFQSRLSSHAYWLTRSYVYGSVPPILGSWVPVPPIPVPLISGGSRKLCWCQLPVKENVETKEGSRIWTFWPLIWHGKSNISFFSNFDFQSESVSRYFSPAFFPCRYQKKSCANSVWNQQF